MAIFFSYFIHSFFIILYFFTVNVTFFPSHALACRSKNSIAIFLALDKITGRVYSLEIPINETYKFGTLEITPRACYNSFQKDFSRTDAFVEINANFLNKRMQRIFTGWMFADSPGLNALEHPVYDVWLKKCKNML